MTYFLCFSKGMCINISEPKLFQLNHYNFLNTFVSYLLSFYKAFEDEPEIIKAAFGPHSTRILKLHKKYLAQIIGGEKKYEIRNCLPSRHLQGWVTLAETGSMQIKARVKFGAAHTLTQDEMVESADARDIWSKYKTPYAWPIEELELLEVPVKIPLWVGRGSCVVTKDRWKLWVDRSYSSSQERRLDGE